MKTNMYVASRFIQWSVAGDGYVGFSTNNRDAHYSISRDPKHADYIGLIQGKLEVIPNVSVSVSEYVRKDNGKHVLSLRTSSHPIFTRIRQRQYINNHRVIEPHMLTTLGWEEMAYLYADDGSITYTNNGSQVVRVSTCAYSHPEQMELRRTIIERLGVCFNVNKASRGLYQLNLARKDHDVFFERIKPLLPLSYHYKLPASLQEDAPTQFAA